MHFQREVRLSTVTAWVVWVLGMCGVGLGLKYGPNVGHVGIALCIAGNMAAAWTFFRDLERREKRAFELGREHERVSHEKEEVRRIR